MSVVIKRNDVVTWRGKRVGRVDRTKRGLMFAPDALGLKGVIHGSTLASLRESIRRACLDAENKRIIDFAANL